MKSNIIKYIFALFVIAIIIFAVYKIYNSGETKKNSEQANLVGSNIEILTNIRIGIAEFDNINPIISQNRDVINLSTIIYEPLLSLSENYKIEFALAKECSKINEKTYIVKLRENLKWENGNSITAKDVYFTITKLKEGKSIYSENVKNVNSVEIIDDLTIKIILNKEESFFEYNLVFPIISSQQFEGEKDFYKSRIAPISSGRYKVKSATADNMELIKNDNWYKKEEVSSKIETIKINFYDTMGDVYNSFKIGNIDMICTSNLNISDYIGTIGYATKDYKSRELDFISLNCKSNILSNKEVRQAINYAINRKQIISSVYGNEYYTSSFPIDYGSYLYTKDIDSSYNQNKAKKILQDAGWEYKYARWQKTENYETKTINIDLYVEEANKQRVKVAELIESQLEDIGINVNLYKISNKLYKDYLASKEYDMLITGVYNGYSPDLSYFIGENNINQYENNEINSILSELNTITDEEKVKEKYNRIIEIYEDEMPCICLYRNKSKVVYSMKLTGEFNPNSYSVYYHIDKWYRQ